jgi:hypothetical protein
VQGAAQAERQLRTLGRTAADTAKQANAAAAGPVLSARREFMAGQRLQGTVTGMLGINNALTQTVDGFERLGYMAEASGMKMGEFLKRVGPGALSAAAAVVTLTMAWNAWNGELAKTNASLEKGGWQKLTQWQNLKLLFGGNVQMRADPEKMAAKLLKELEDKTPRESLAAFIEKNPGTGSQAAWRAERDRLLQEQADREGMNKEAGRMKAQFIAFRTGEIQPWLSLYSDMARGGAKLPTGDAFGSREYVANQQAIQEAPKQTQLAEAQLRILEGILDKIRADAGVAATNVFSYP